MKKSVAAPADSTSKFLNRKDLIAYFLVAGTGAAVQLVCSSLLQDWFDLTLTQSVWPSYILSFGVGFVLTKFFAFDARRTNQTRREMVKFVMVAIFSGFVMDLAVRFAVFVTEANFDPFEYQIPYSTKVVDVTGLACYIFGMGCSFVSNYTLHKTFTFTSTGFYDRLKSFID